MVSIDLISLLIGIGYGYIKPGKEEKKALLKKGALIGADFCQKSYLFQYSTTFSTGAISSL